MTHDIRDDSPLWVPPPERVANSLLAKFMALAGERTGQRLSLIHI